MLLLQLAAAADAPADAPAAGGPPWTVFFVVAAVVVVIGLVLLVLGIRKANEDVEEPCPSCGRIMMPEQPVCMFCKTPRGYRVASLEFISGPLIGKIVKLDGEVTSIGAAPGSTVVLVDTGVSRKHAGIRKNGMAYELADMGSTNGVYVNGEKVPKKPLQMGDVIRIGTSEMVFKA